MKKAILTLRDDGWVQLHYTSYNIFVGDTYTNQRVHIAKDCKSVNDESISAGWIQVLRSLTKKRKLETIMQDILHKEHEVTLSVTPRYNSQGPQGTTVPTAKIVYMFYINNVNVDIMIFEGSNFTKEDIANAVASHWFNAYTLHILGIRGALVEACEANDNHLTVAQFEGIIAPYLVRNRKQ